MHKFKVGDLVRRGQWPCSIPYEVMGTYYFKAEPYYSLKNLKDGITHSFISETGLIEVPSFRTYVNPASAFKFKVGQELIGNYLHSAITVMAHGPGDGYLVQSVRSGSTYSVGRSMLENLFHVEEKWDGTRTVTVGRHQGDPKYIYKLACDKWLKQWSRACHLYATYELRRRSALSLHEKYEELVAREAFLRERYDKLEGSGY